MNADDPAPFETQREGAGPTQRAGRLFEADAIAGARMRRGVDAGMTGEHGSEGK